MLTKDNKALVAIAGNEEICILPEMINRHGLITGATGTGKTVSLQTLAETFSQMGIAVFMADIKGDLSGIAEAGNCAGKVAERVEKLNLESRGYAPMSFPVCFWDIAGQKGHPLRTTVSDIGPLLLARILNLNEVQSGVLQIIFRIADDNGLLLLDLKDLRSMVQHACDERARYGASYGQISPASIGAIQRALLRLEEEGGDRFFGEPALDIMDLMQTAGGKGLINILDATTLVNTPQLYSCVLLWLLSELFERLPEVGDRNKPVLAFFFDEAHLLFSGISPVLLQKIEQVTRLIRSRGVGIYFVSQNPSDMPDSILGQLGNRIQHALRAFTPKDQKSVRAAAMAFRANPDFSTGEVIGNLAVGEALVSFLDHNGAPNIVQKGKIVPPQSHIGPISEEQRKRHIAASPVSGKYEQAVDRESAYEILTARAEELQFRKMWEEKQKAEEKAQKQAEKEARKQEAERRRAEKERRENDPFGNLLGSVVKQTTRSMTNTVGREIGKTLLRGILGGLLGGKK